MRETSFPLQRRPDRGLIRVRGAEAGPFLHNLLTADILSLGGGEARYAALLTPQGKILFDMFVVKEESGFLIDCAMSQRAELLKRLALYRLRAKLDIDEISGLEVGVASERPNLGLAYADPRLADIGFRTVAPTGSLPDGDGYEAARIALGLADSTADLAPGEFFPHEANLDRLNGVSFTKGCYVGQEVVSRMQHRGLARSRILPVKLEGNAPPRATPITAGGKAIGTLLSSSGTDALALLRLDRLAETRESLEAGSVRLTVRKPHWLGDEMMA